MDNKMVAVEMHGRIDENRQLHLEGMLPVPGPMPVRVIVLYAINDEWDEAEWLHMAARNPAFDFLKDSEEDIYSLADGAPFDAQA